MFQIPYRIKARLIYAISKEISFSKKLITRTAKAPVKKLSKNPPSPYER
jgi:hypothetical protein